MNFKIFLVVLAIMLATSYSMRVAVKRPHSDHQAYHLEKDNKRDHQHNKDSHEHEEGHSCHHYGNSTDSNPDSSTDSNPDDETRAQAETEKSRSFNNNLVDSNSEFRTQLSI